MQYKYLMKKIKKQGRPKTLNPKDVILNFMVTQKTSDQLDEFIKISGFDNRSDFLRRFVTAAVSGNEHDIMRFFQVIMERATKQLLMKSLTGKMLKR